MRPIQKRALAYVVGVALGDGNLSNPNKRAVRLRISCDTRYPKIQEEIIRNLKIVLPENKISKAKHTGRNCIDISIYSNKLEEMIPWNVGHGSKEKQNAHVPLWIMNNKIFSKNCLRGLLQTDGSIYRDRGYLMVNFTNNILQLCEEVLSIMKKLGYRPTFHQAKNESGTTKYTVRLARNTKEFIDEIKLTKS